MKKIKDYGHFKNILPYQSEIFGVYQPLLGWKSKRLLNRLNNITRLTPSSRLEELTKYFRSQTSIGIDTKNCVADKLIIDLGEFIHTAEISQQNSVLLQVLGRRMAENPPRTAAKWKTFIDKNDPKEIFYSDVFPIYQQEFKERCEQIKSSHSRTLEVNRVSKNVTGIEAAPPSAEGLKSWLTLRLQFESEIARIIYELAGSQEVELLNKVFYPQYSINNKEAFWKDVKNFDADERSPDPYLTFDPHKDIKNVSLSPLGIVHLFRQFFFEFDTFLGTPTGHVWMAPGSTVELIEVSQRKTITEKFYETSYETITKTEKSTTEQDEISEAVKKDNKDDLKLGFSTTVNQSWGTGNASATASINMDKTQQVARETTHKKMREQTQKLSAEIRENFKSTFKTVTEVTDTSSKRYVLANNTEELINYELRRKMRQVGVQVQDIGTYLCWETYVDEPGSALGLGNLLHIAKPADLLPQPDVNNIPPPPDKFVPFQVNVVWDFDDRQFNEAHPDVGYEFVPITTYQIPPAEDGYELAPEGYHVRAEEIKFGGFSFPLPPPEQDRVANLSFIPLNQISGTGEDFHGVWAFTGMFTDNNNQIKVGVHTTPGKGLGWDERVDFLVGGTLKYVPTLGKRNEIAAANDAKIAAKESATAENKRLTEEAYLTAVKERVEMSRNITQRKYEDLREEERIVVYRNLIGELMTEAYYQINNPSDKGQKKEGNRNRHVMAELINSIFDVDKMLYFVAPEWWQPRARPNYIGVNQFRAMSDDAVVSWSDNQPRLDNYLITDKSKPAPLGSSLGWLLQLDGDNLRNAFLNAPWVRAVIPVRPGKELAAINWLQNVGVEGTEGLENEYAASDTELAEIRSKLLKNNPTDPVKDHAKVTISDAIRFLCLQVSEKHEESNKTDVYPKGAEINDDDKVSATPIDKVYEYGFYPLQGSFRYDPANPDPNNPDRNFQVFDQWVEILPTDQVVPVEVKYDPKTGKQM